jgi:hypothetical protein
VQDGGLLMAVIPRRPNPAVNRTRRHVPHRERAFGRGAGYLRVRRHRSPTSMNTSKIAP